VKKLIARGAAVVVATAVSMAVFGSGAAMADYLVGKTYEDASAEIEGNWNATAIIATVVGARLPTDECIVTRWQRNTNDHNRIMFSLNCNAGVASATAPGNSAASPEGRAVKEEQEAEAWRSTADGQVWCKENERAHPDLAGC
jgi:hypothetical protein